MENQQSAAETIIETAGDYTLAKIKLMKLQVAQTASETTAALFSGLILVLIINIALLLLSTAIAVWIGNYTGKMYCGFLAAGGFYILAAIIVFIFRRKWLIQPFQNFVIKKILG